MNIPSKLISLNSVHKRFGQNTVLDGIDFQLHAGEIHALVGENGAGKSTCMGLLYGLHQPDSGELRLNEKPVRIDGTAHAQSLGIGCVFQELSLAGSLSVAENIFAGRAPSRFGLVDWPSLRTQAETLLSEFGLTLDVSRPVNSLPVSTQQIVEIAKALSMDSRILLLDEPTSALTPNEVKTLFVVLKRLVEKGIGIVYVSHHLSEVFNISDRITVLRDGKCISTKSATDTTQAQVINDMLGSAEPVAIESVTRKTTDDLLSVNALNGHGKFSNISFSVKRGEILGLAGLLGSRRNDIVRALVGLEKISSGYIRYQGSVVAFPSIRQAIKAGIAYVPEERKTDGLFLSFSLSANLIASSLDKHAVAGIMRDKSIQAASNVAVDTFDVKTQGTNEVVGSLSGGNQQKILLGKWLELNPQLLIIEEPTKGVDVGAKFQIHEELLRRAEKGMTIIIVSSDFPELITLSDRILVIQEGRLNGEVAANAVSEDELLMLTAGAPIPQDYKQPEGATL